MPFSSIPLRYATRPSGAACPWAQPVSWFGDSNTTLGDAIAFFIQAKTGS